jgi:cysteine desulfurase
MASSTQSQSSHNTNNRVLVAVMMANNESGALQPVKEIAQECRKRNILIFTDAAQALGKVDVHGVAGDVDMMAIVGHKIGAPKGIACLYIRPGALPLLRRNGQQQQQQQPPMITPLLHGGGQEFGLRSGTENVPYIVGLATAVDRAVRHRSSHARHMEALRHRLLLKLQDGLGEHAVVVHGPTDPNKRLPNTLSVAFRTISSSDDGGGGGGVGSLLPEKKSEPIRSVNILSAIRDRVAASAGATCHQATGTSSVLAAMGISPDLARATIRLSVGPSTTTDEIDRAATILIETVKSQSPSSAGTIRSSNRSSRGHGPTSAATTFSILAPMPP